MKQEREVYKVGENGSRWKANRRGGRGGGGKGGVGYECRVRSGLRSECGKGNVKTRWK